MLRPPLSLNVYISFSTMSVVSPTPRTKSSVASNVGRADLAVAEALRDLAGVRLEAVPVGRTRAAARRGCRAGRPGDSREANFPGRGPGLQWHPLHGASARPRPLLAGPPARAARACSPPAGRNGRTRRAIASPRRQRRGPLSATRLANARISPCRFRDRGSAPRSADTDSCLRARRRRRGTRRRRRAWAKSAVFPKRRHALDLDVRAQTAPHRIGVEPGEPRRHRHDGGSRDDRRSRAPAYRPESRRRRRSAG